MAQTYPLPTAHRSPRRHPRRPPAAAAAQPSERRRRKVGRPHLVVLTIGAAGIVAHQLLPERFYEYSYDGIDLFVIGAMLWGIRRRRPRPARPWVLLAAGVGLLAVGDVIYNALLRIHGEEVFPSIADAPYLASYPVLSWAVVDILRSRRRTLDRTALIDAVLVTVAGAAIAWVYLIAPSDYTGVPVLTAVVSVAYPVGDIVLLALLARLLFAPGRRPPAERILAAGISLLLVADVAYARLTLTGLPGAVAWLDAVFLASALCFAVAACHPTMRSLTVAELGYVRKQRARPWLLAGISLVLPVLSGFQVALGHERNALVLATAAAMGFFLLTFRTGVLNSMLAAALDREEDALRRERVLRHLGTVLVTAVDRAEVFEAAVDHARQVAGAGADAFVLSAGDGTQGRGLPDDLVALLSDGRAAVVEAGDQPELRRLIPADAGGRAIVAPIFSQRRVRSVLVVAPGGAAGGAEREETARLTDACEAVASAVSVALDGAELAERLVDERSEQRFGAMIRNSSDIVLVLRPDGSMRYITPSVTRVLGWDPADLMDEHVATRVHPDDLFTVLEAFQGALAAPGLNPPVQCRYRHKDGSWRHMEAIGTSLVDDPGVAGIIVNVRDVTDRVVLAESLRASEERLASQVIELQELHQAKDDFVATVSHELRTPLTCILGQLELLADGDYGPLVGAQAKAVDVMDRNGRRLLVLIEDLLTVARIDSARLQLSCTPTDLAPFAAGVHASVAGIAAARPVSLCYDAEPCLGTATIDTRQMERALTNLLTNAIKFTPCGGRVDFLVRRAGDDVLFTVADTGIGIPVEEQERLFTRFFRSTVATRMAVQGSGLGLHIAKCIVEEHGGTIELRSVEGHGTTVTVAIPVPGEPLAQDVAEGVGVVAPQG